MRAEGEVGVDDANAAAGGADGFEEGVVNDVGGDVRVAVHHSHLFPPRRRGGIGRELREVVGGAFLAGIVLRAADILPRHAVPKSEEHGLQFAHGVALHAGVQVVPAAKLGTARDVVVRHVHAAGIGHHAVDDYDLAVVAVQGVVDVGEAQGVEVVDLYALGFQAVEVPAAQRAVVGTVAEAVEQSPHLDALGCLCAEDFEEFLGNGVVAEVEIFEVDAFAGSANGGEEVFELLATGGEEHHAVVARELHAEAAFEEAHDGRVAPGCRQRVGGQEHAGLCLCRKNKSEGGYDEDKQSFHAVIKAIEALLAPMAYIVAVGRMSNAVGTCEQGLKGRGVLQNARPLTSLEPRSFARPQG